MPYYEHWTEAGAACTSGRSGTRPNAGRTGRAASRVRCLRAGRYPKHPRSRYNPQFNGDSLRSRLRSRRLRYAHLSDSEAFAEPKDSANTGWHNASFRGFADYMLTEEFGTGLAELRARTAVGRVALMCAEAVPWRCHRSLVADALTARGAQVEHITSVSRSNPPRPPFARVDGTHMTYPGEEARAARHSGAVPSRGDRACAAAPAGQPGRCCGSRGTALFAGAGEGGRSRARGGDEPRNTLEVDRSVFERIAPGLPNSVVKIAESGVRGATRPDQVRLRRCRRGAGRGGAGHPEEPARGGGRAGQRRQPAGHATAGPLTQGGVS